MRFRWERGSLRRGPRRGTSPQQGPAEGSIDNVASASLWVDAVATRVASCDGGKGSVGTVVSMLVDPVARSVAGCNASAIDGNRFKTRLSGSCGGGGSGGGRTNNGDPTWSVAGTRLAGMRKGTRIRPTGRRTEPVDDCARRRRSRNFSVVMARERLPSAIR
eukprot:6469161-Amphidinium_carterae.6